MSQLNKWPWVRVLPVRAMPSFPMIRGRWWPPDTSADRQTPLPPPRASWRPVVAFETNTFDQFRKSAKRNVPSSPRSGIRTRIRSTLSRSRTWRPAQGSEISTPSEGHSVVRRHRRRRRRLASFSSHGRRFDSWSPNFSSDSDHAPKNFALRLKKTVVDFVQVSSLPSSPPSSLLLLLLFLQPLAGLFCSRVPHYRDYCCFVAAAAFRGRRRSQHLAEGVSGCVHQTWATEF